MTEREWRLAQSRSGPRFGFGSSNGNPMVRAQRFGKNSAAQVVDSHLNTIMKNGIRRADIDILEKEIDSADTDKSAREAVEEGLESARERQRDLRKQFDRLRRLSAGSPQAHYVPSDSRKARNSLSLRG